MITRCFNPNASRFKTYGAVGITACERWRSFENFLADMGERPSTAHSLDRYPNKRGNYEPGNVRWATMHEQNLNRSTTRPVRRYDGVEFNSIYEAVAATPGTTKNGIGEVCSGRTKAHRGKVWEYIK